MAGKSVLKIMGGAGVAAFGVILSFTFFDAFKALVLGAIGPLLIFVGLVMIAIAKE